MLLAEPPAKPVCGVPVDESVCRCNRTKVEVIGPPSKFLIQTFNHFPGVQPFHVSACLDTTPENDSNEILTQVIGLTCSGQTGRIHRADFDFWGLAEER